MMEARRANTQQGASGAGTTTISRAADTTTSRAAMNRDDRSTRGKNVRSLYPHHDDKPAGGFIIIKRKLSFSLVLSLLF